jgi:hypothetical protein
MMVRCGGFSQQIQWHSDLDGLVFLGQGCGLAAIPGRDDQEEEKGL